MRVFEAANTAHTGDAPETMLTTRQRRHAELIEALQSGTAQRSARKPMAAKPGRRRETLHEDFVDSFGSRFGFCGFVGAPCGAVVALQQG